MSNRLTVQFVGDPTDKGDVRLGDLIEQLQRIRKALRQTEIGITQQGQPSLEYKIVDLRHASPATFVLQPIPIGPEAVANIPTVIQSFTNELSMIKRERKLLMYPELERLEAYEGIGIRETNRIQKVVIRAARKVVTIDRKFKKNLSVIIGPDQLADGTISGTLEALNFHKTNRFVLYPILGPQRVQGTFQNSLRPGVKEAIGNYVTVFGRLRYKAWATFPHGIIAKDIDIHEPDSKLPTLTDLRGSFTGRLGPPDLPPMNSAEYVDYLRHEDW